MVEIIGCPVDTTLDIIGKKWTINIINDLLFGIKRFSKLMEANQNLTPKMLSSRLKELEQHRIIEKRLIDMTPIKVEYHLTERGKNLRKILFELAIFAALNEPEKVLADPDAPLTEVITTIGNMYKFSEKEIETYIKLQSNGSLEQEILSI